jgi:autotransporter-associated beta strand protein
VALNGGLTLNAGGVAYFDLNVTSTSLALDGTGLITGLQGAGLIYNGSKPTDLATINGSGVILAYSGYTSVATGNAIPNGASVNYKFSTAGANGTYSTAGAISVNTIRSIQTGNSGGTLTDTLTLGGTLTFGDKGGVYVLDAVAGNKQCLVINPAGQHVTAGTSAGATLIFAVNGTTSGNQLAVNSVISDNSGGAVSVVTTGPGSLYFNPANTYSGWTYVNQGQLQGNNVASCGTGPIYVAGGATFYLVPAGTILNEVYLSPGVGAGSAAAYASGGALIYGGNGAIFSGKIHLQGAPVTAAPGCRVSTTATSQTLTFSGQITGTGTLEIYGGGHSGNTVLANAAANNNWQGGILIAPRSTLSAYFKLGLDNQIPNGPNTGDITLISGGGDARFDLNGHSTTINALNAPSSGTVAKQELGNYSSPTFNSTLTMGANNNNGTFYGVTSDGAGKTLSLVKIGSGTQTFNGAAAFGYLGNTTVSNGTFALAGAGQIPNSPVITVAAGATLDGSLLSAGGLTIGVAQTLNCVGTVIGNTTINGTIKALDAIGTLTDTGNMTFNGGGTYVWDINDGTGTMGGPAGWSWLNISGTLDLSSLNSGSQFTINVNSLTSPGDAPGTALHFDHTVAKSWIIATAGSINGYLDPTQFNVVHSAFQNYSGGAWDVTVSGNNLMLNYNPFSAIVSLTPATLTVNQTQPAVFTATANSLGTGTTTFTWTQGATTLSDGGASAGGGTVHIVTSGLISTLTIANVDGAAPWPSATDTSTITATVNDNYSGSPQVGTLSAALTVIDTPYSPNVAPSFGTQPTSAGAADILCASASGTSPFTYQWYLNGNLISGATAPCYQVNVSPATVGSYTVVISNPAGGVTSSATVITGPVTEVPNQSVFEPFNYAIQPTTQSSGNPWTAFGVTNIYNQATGVGLMWVNTGTLGQEWTRPQDMRIEPGYDNATLTPNGDAYPWPGLAGNDPQEMVCNSGNTGVGLPLGTGGSISSGTVYFSMVCHVDQGGSITSIGNDFFCGFGTGSPGSPAYNAGIYIQAPGDDTYIPGVFKASAGKGALDATPGTGNGGWSGTHYHRGQIIFVVCRLTINPGAANDTCDLWIDPSPFTFYASEANVPTPDVANVGGSAPDVGNVDFFWIKSTVAPASRRFTDLRIGTTWASVTPPAPPTLSLANVALSPGATTAVLASQNPGNPVNPGVGPYQWQFNGGPALIDGATGHGSTISGSGTDTLTITGVTAADLGTYTVTGSNADPLNSYSDPSASPPVTGDRVFNPTGTNFVGSVSALLTTTRPALSILSSPPNIIVSWPTNWAVMLEATTSLAQPITWAPVIGGESSFLYWPPGSGVLAWAPVSPLTISGANYTVTVTAGSSSPMFFRLFPSP